MVILTKIDKRLITINADEIETIDSSHDSTITLKTGKKIIVNETAEEIIQKVVDYRKKCFAEVLGKDKDSLDQRIIK